jgi:hypothetical protein
MVPPLNCHTHVASVYKMCRSIREKFDGHSAKVYPCPWELSAPRGSWHPADLKYRLFAINTETLDIARIEKS